MATDFDGSVASYSTEVIVTAPRAQNMKAHCERVIRSIQEKFPNRFWFVGDTALRRGLDEYVDW